MKPSGTLLWLLVLLAGCLPLKRAELVSGPLFPRMILCDDRYLLIEIDMRTEKILTAQSRIAAPSGKAYSIQVEPHQYDIEQDHQKLRPEVYPCNADGSRIQHWPNGTWSFHFVVETNGIAQAIDQRWKYSTFYYNPIIHGPPN